MNNLFDVCVVTRKLGKYDSVVSAVIIRKDMTETECRKLAKQHIEELKRDYPEFREADFYAVIGNNVKVHEFRGFALTDSYAGQAIISNTPSFSVRRRS